MPPFIEEKMTRFVNSKVFVVFAILLFTWNLSFVFSEETQSKTFSGLKYKDTSLRRGELLAQAEATESAPLAKKYFVEGKTYFDQGDYENALEFFRKSLFEDPTDPVLNHLMGRAAFELGSFEEALFAFERVLVLNPNLALSRLEKARTHLALGSNLEAKEELLRVLEADIPPEVRANVETLLAQIGSERKHEVSGVLLLSNLWDANATLGTGPLPLPQAPSLTSDPTTQSDRIFSTALVFSHKFPLAKEGLTWKNGVTGFLSDNTTLNTNDLLLGAYSSGLEYSFKRHLFDITGSLTAIILAGDLYQSTPAATVKYNYAYSPRLSFTGGGNYTRRHHFSTAGTESTFGFVNSYNLGASFLRDDKNTWNLSWTQKFDKSPRDLKVASSYYRYEIALGYTRVLTDRISLILKGTRRHDEYAVVHDVFVDRQRSDLTRLGNIGLNFKITPTLLLDVAGAYTDNDSNIPNNTYITKQGILTLTALFGP
jgi:tetratricopeptide (TPR) repeat protein